MYDEIDYCATCKHYDCEPHFYQEMLDKELKQIFGEIQPFRERYPYLKEWNYNKPCRK